METIMETMMLENDDLTMLQDCGFYVDDNDSNVSSHIPDSILADSQEDENIPTLYQLDKDAQEVQEEEPVDCGGYESDSDLANFLNELEEKPDVDDVDDDEFALTMKSFAMANEERREEEPVMEDNTDDIISCESPSETDCSPFFDRCNGTTPSLLEHQPNANESFRGINTDDNNNTQESVNTKMIKHVPLVSPYPPDKDEVLLEEEYQVTREFDFSNISAPEPERKPNGSVWYDLSDVPDNLLLRRVESFSASEVYPHLSAVHPPPQIGAMTIQTKQNNRDANSYSNRKINSKVIRRGNDKNNKKTGKKSKSISTNTNNDRFARRNDNSGYYKPEASSSFVQHRELHRRVVQTPYGPALLVGPPPTPIPVPVLVPEQQTRRKRNNNWLDLTDSLLSEGSSTNSDEHQQIQHWTDKEDFILRYAINTEGDFNWGNIASNYFRNSRSALECKNRWYMMTQRSELRQTLSKRSRVRKQYCDIYC